MSVSSSSGPGMAQSIRDTVMAHAAEAERLRTLPPPVVDALWQSGLMQWMNPVEAGGSAPSVREMIDTWKELARQDASTGWIGIGPRRHDRAGHHEGPDG